MNALLYCATMNVVRHKITTAGQVSIPADVRRRWDTDSVVIEDYGDHLVVRPRPSDAIEAARGALKGKGRNISADEMIRIMDEDERRAQARKERLWSSWMRSH
jgi:bifunctional DNA-binding transcriptional regulator/antitoxin component of YhaV-PrlF toxin-antitoxin module